MGVVPRGATGKAVGAVWGRGIPKGRGWAIALGITRTAQLWELCLLWLTDDNSLTHLSHTDTIPSGPPSDRDSGNRVEPTKEL